MAPNDTQKKYKKYSGYGVGLGVLAAILLIGGQFWDPDTSPPPLESYLTDQHKENVGNYGPVPSGAPDDPFHITTIEGDGWRIYDSGPGLMGGGEAPFYWIGKKQVFFRAQNSPQFRSREVKEKNKHKINEWFYLWDVDTGIRRLDDLPVASRYCYSEGIFYVGNIWRGAKNGIKKLLTLRDGEIKEDNDLVEKLDSSIPEKNYGWNHFRCNWNTSPKGKYEDLIMIGLREGDGRLFHFDSSRYIRHPVILFNSQKGIDLQLPFSNHDVETLCTRYFEFKGAYFLYDCGARGDPSGEKVRKWEQDNCLPAWWMWPDGRTEKICIPYGPWAIRADWNVIPTARGLFLHSMDSSAITATGGAGGYLFRDGKLKKIITGLLSIPRQFQKWVSSDGCRIAFGYAPTWDAWVLVGPGRYTTRILDVCVEGKG